MTDNEAATALKTVTDEYRAEIATLTGPKPRLSKRQADDMIAGFEDGARAMLARLRRTGVLSRA